MKKPDTPFPKHWLYYIVLKYVVIAAAILIALYVAFQLAIALERAAAKRKPDPKAVAVRCR